MKKFNLLIITTLLTLNVFSQIDKYNFKITNENFDSLKTSRHTKNKAKAHPFPSLFLKGDYAEISVHPAGSFGGDIFTPIPDGYHATSTFWSSPAIRDSILGFNCDHQKDGYEVGTPSYMGDFFVPGAPLEGWGVEWTTSEGESNFINFGAIADYAPSFWEIPVNEFYSYSNSYEQTVVGVYTASNSTGQLQITQTVKLKPGDLFFTIEINLKNTGSTTLTSVEYLRNVDPDNDVRPSNSYAYNTINYVTFQPGTASNLDTAVVIAKGPIYGVPLSLGTVHPYAKVTAEAVINNGELIYSPDQVLDSPVAPSVNAPVNSDIQIALAYRFPELQPGQCVNFAFFYNMSTAPAHKYIFPITADFETIETETGNFTLTDKSFGIGASSIYKWEWDFENDGIYDATGQTIDKDFSNICETEVKLRVETCDGKIDSVIHKIKYSKLQIKRVNINNPLCFGETGIIEIDAIGGNENYFYKLNDGEFQENNIFDYLPQGEYKITIKDNYSCFAEFQDIFTIKAPEELKINNVETTVSCFNLSNGSLTFSAEGGNPDYLYKINSQEYQPNNFFENLNPGIHQIYILDANNCEANFEYEIQQSNQINILDIKTKPLSCSYTDDGIIGIKADGGEGELSYSLDNQTFTNQSFFENLEEGKYKLFIKDELNCLITTDVSITKPDTILAENITVTQKKCHEDFGEIEILASGGTGDLWFNINDSEFTQTNIFENLPAGEYQINIKDQNNCNTALSKIAITEIPQIVFQGINGNATCVQQLEDTEIEILAYGGTGNLNYALDNQEYQSSNIFNNLKNNIYELFIKDDNNCILKTDIDLNFYLNPKVEIINKDINICQNSEFQIFANTNINNSNILKQEWSGDIDKIDNLNTLNPFFDTQEVGNYKLKIYIEDINNCKTEDSINITILQTPDLELGKDTTICATTEFLLNAGEHHAYQWNENPLLNSQFFNVTETGKYLVTVTTEDNCSNTDSINIVLSNIILDEVIVNQILCAEQNDGQIKIESSSYDSQLWFSINNSEFYTNNIFSNLAPADYMITIKDKNNCYLDVEKITITDAPKILLENISGDKVCLNDFSESELKISSSGGTGELNFSLDNINFQEDTIFYELQNIEYTLYIKDQNSCMREFNFKPEFYINPQVLIAEDSSVVCQNTELQIITYLYFQNSNISEFQWIGNTEKLDMLNVFSPFFDTQQAGEYFLKINVIDQNNCYDSDSIYILINEKPLFSLGEDIISCDKKEIILDAGNFHSYSWNQDEHSNQQFFTATESGKYFVNVIDTNNCENSDTINIIISSPPQAEAIVSDIKCFGDKNGEIILGINQQDCKIFINNKATDYYINGLDKGIYNINIINQYNCQTAYVYEIQEPSQLNLVTEGKTSVCDAAAEGYINYTISGGVPEYDIFWYSKGNNKIEDLTRLFADTYFCIITDKNGCQLRDSVIIKSQECISNLDIPNIFTPNGDGENDLFKMINYQGINVFSCKIYNRWGTKIYQWSNIDEGWDGNYNDKRQAPAGVYFCEIYAEGIDGKIYSTRSFLHLVR